MRGASCIRRHKKYQQGCSLGQNTSAAGGRGPGGRWCRLKSKILQKIRHHLKIPPLTSEDGPYSTLEELKKKNSHICRPIHKKQKKQTRTFMMISNFKNHLFSMVYTSHSWRSQSLIVWLAISLISK